MTPKYMKIYTAIKESIANGTYTANEMLPTGEFLAKEHNCSVLTVKKALDRLVSEGYIVRKRGLGSFVKRIVEENHDGTQKRYEKISTFSRDLIRPDYSAVIETFDIVKCEDDIALKLNIQTNDFVYHIVRARLYKGDPRIIEHTWMPVSLIPGLRLKDVEGSIYYYITKQLKRNIQSSHVAFQAERPDELDKKYFHMQDTDFVCILEETAFLDTAEIFQYSLSHHVPQYFRFETTLIKELYEDEK